MLKFIMLKWLSKGKLFNYVLKGYGYILQQANIIVHDGFNYMSTLYEHTMHYYKQYDKIFAIIPSMDIVVSLKKCESYPKKLLSCEKPIFHKSYNRVSRIKRVFVLTSACNLQCSYCFEGTHKKPEIMNKEIVQASIEEMFKEAAKQNKKLISFSLFGGEPSLNWDAVEGAVNTAVKLENETGIRCYKAIVTNGVMPLKNIQYLSKYMDFVYFSLDGPKDLFLQQRKPKAGSEIYDTIFNNAKEVYKSDVYLSFKITVTKLTIDYLKEIDDFFSFNFPACSRMYQPCMVDKSSNLYISYAEFFEKYDELKNYSIFNQNMTTPLYKNKPSDRFCNLMIRNVVYPDGSVLACHRSNMCIPDDVVKRTFKVGVCNNNGKISKNKDMLNYINKFTVDSIDDCYNCSLKYHCCGGCATIKLLSENNDMFRKADYCEDFQKYFFCNIFERLYDEQIDYKSFDIPINYQPNCESMMYEQFFNLNVEKNISIEE